MFNWLCLRCRAFSPSALRAYTSSIPATAKTQAPLPTTTTLRAFSSSPFQRSLLSHSISQTTTRLPLQISSLTAGSNSGIGSFGSFSTTQTRSFSASSSLGAQRKTYNPSRRVQKRRHGFLARKRTRTGRNILKRRRAKGKKALSW